jgi:TPR repeat protein
MAAITILLGTILAFAAGAAIGRPVLASEPQKHANEVADFLETYRAGAQAGKPEDQYNLGASYRWGVGTERNLILAAQWIGKAAEQGYPLAERTIGEMYEKGEGLPASREQAMRWYKRAARHGDTLAAQDVSSLEAKIHPAAAPSHVPE